MNCGPFESDNLLSPIVEVDFFPKDGSLGNRVVLSLLVQFSVFLIIYMVGFSSSEKIKVLNEIK